MTPTIIFNNLVYNIDAAGPDFNTRSHVTPKNQIQEINLVLILFCREEHLSALANIYISVSWG